MRVVVTSAPPDQAPVIARQLVEERLAACVQCAPVTSHYRWKEALEEEAEVVLWIKVAEDRVHDLVARILELHPYELPEIVTFPVDAHASLGAYVQWVRDETRPR